MGGREDFICSSDRNRSFGIQGNETIEGACVLLLIIAFVVPWFFGRQQTRRPSLNLVQNNL
jgi:hypothetical protein